MDYEISAPAQHAAHVILRNFIILPTGRIEATPSNLATLIDVATQSFRLVKVMDTLVKNAPWWNASALHENLEQLQDAVRSVETVLDNIPQYAKDNGNGIPVNELKEFVTRYRVSAPALYAARSIQQHFLLRRKGALDATERNIAILVDVCTQVFRVEMAVRYFLTRIPWQHRAQAGQALKEMQEGLRVVELVRNRMPAKEKPIKITLYEKQEVEFEVTKAQMRDAQQFASLVANARTVDEQQTILMKAGLVRH